MKGRLQVGGPEPLCGGLTPTPLDLVAHLIVPSLPRVVIAQSDDSEFLCAIRAREERVFDAWAWCASDVLEWRRPAASSFDKSLAVDAQNPADLVFVFKADVVSTLLPRELARFHAKGYALDGEWALAPYAIDDATDVLYERRIRPRDVFWLAAPSLRALVWGLHDWAHFHNHGPFDDPPMTELQCDLLALAWLRLNRDVVGLSDEDLANVERDLVALSRSRFAAEAEDRAAPPLLIDFEGLFARAHRPQAGVSPTHAAHREGAG